MEITTIGLDIAKRVFQAHGVNAAGRAVLRGKLGRSEVIDFFRALQPCLVGIEACGTAHHWAREPRALGHEVRLIPAAYVKPYVKHGKVNATLPDEGMIATVTLEEAVELLDAKAGKGKAKPKARSKAKAKR